MLARARWDDYTREQIKNRVRHGNKAVHPSQNIPLAEIVCPRCDGSRRDCARCSGSGRERVLEWPATDQGITDAFTAYGYLEAGILPAHGGLQDQCAWFLAAVREINAERCACEEDNEKRQSVPGARR